MTNQIIIPLTRSDQIREMLPYLERIAQPGVKIVFLLHVNLSRFEELTAQLLAIHSGLFFLSCPDDEDEFVRRQIRSAEEQIFPYCSSLREKGIEMMVSVFAGSLRKVIRDYAQQNEVHLVMMRGGAGGWLIRALRHVVSRLHRFRTETLPPVLLLHPASIVGRFR